MWLSSVPPFKALQRVSSRLPGFNVALTPRGATICLIQSGLLPPRLDCLAYDAYRRSKLEIGSGQVMRVVPLSEDATPKFLKGGFYEAQQQEDLDCWDKCFFGDIWNTVCFL